MPHVTESGEQLAGTIWTKGFIALLPSYFKVSLRQTVSQKEVEVAEPLPEPQEPKDNARAAEPASKKNNRIYVSFFGYGQK
ncbi:MAG: hypothetical protein BGO56_18045 [Sphingobacteriales bacterium 48-107]|nr:MAG: hypothetical protein BGO56_18045 [Sphingobacteriales bacterium 48-107]